MSILNFKITHPFFKDLEKGQEKEKSKIFQNFHRRIVSREKSWTGVVSGEISSRIFQDLLEMEAEKRAGRLKEGGKK